MIKKTETFDVCKRPDFEIDCSFEEVHEERLIDVNQKSNFDVNFLFEDPSQDLESKDTFSAKIEKDKFKAHLKFPPSGTLPGVVALSTMGGLITALNPSLRVVLLVALLAILVVFLQLFPVWMGKAKSNPKNERQNNGSTNDGNIKQESENKSGNGVERKVSPPP
jgi:hypothetical protein